MRDLSDIDLVMAAKASGNDQAFAVLVRRHQARLRAFLFRLCADASLADDMAQDTFIKAYGALKSFHGGGSFRSWLCAIAYREFLQQRRKAGATMRMEQALTSQSDVDIQNNETGDNLSMDLRRALGQLDEKERAAVILCDAMGLSHSEASTVLSTPLGSVKTYVSRARSKMRAWLSPPEETPGAQCANSKKDEIVHAN